MYRKLLSQARRAGVDVLVGATIIHIAVADRELRLMQSDGETRSISADRIVYAVGFGARELFQRFFGIELPIRFWKSHLIVTRRINQHGVFFLDPHEAAMMQHGEYSVVGLNEDALLCNAPSYDVIPERADNLFRALQRLAPSWGANEFINVACTKVDLATETNGARSLAVAIREPLPGHVCILPGKMTEAPFLADAITRHVYERVNEPLISRRPCDSFGDTLQQVPAHAL
ncbi:MAG: FAD-dependent oxidoreductase [Xanthobacteraceae bacterium]